MIAMHTNQPFIIQQKSTKTTENIKNVRNKDLQESGQSAPVHGEIYDKPLWTDQMEKKQGLWYAMCQKAM